MGAYTGTTALIEALRDPRRNVAALLVVAAALFGAMQIGSREAYYTASLVIFTVWMAWFILTAIEWLKRADF
ncbi:MULTISPECIES: hypothetical protein [unclassified Haladaptatus]|uniref:hypothetical protein n=1 Tax=unclassified Haladaptatus TaxID=2622732 RepID=UPI0023E8B617|nr:MULTISPECIES: hypothetical protein [unclassified Haladaptatus]